MLFLYSLSGFASYAFFTVCLFGMLWFKKKIPFLAPAFWLPWSQDCGADDIPRVVTIWHLHWSEHLRLCWSSLEFQQTLYSFVSVEWSFGETVANSTLDVGDRSAQEVRKQRFRQREGQEKRDSENEKGRREKGREKGTRQSGGRVPRMLIPEAIITTKYKG